MQTQYLKILAEKASQAGQSNQGQIETLYQEGIQALEQTLRSGFADKQALVSSCRAFERMIAFDAQDYRPYLYSGYLLLLMESYSEAEAYLKHAQHLNPEQPDAGTLLQLVYESREQPVFRDWTPGLPRHQQNIDLTRLASEVEGYVQQRLKQLQEMPPLTKAIVSDSAEIDKIQAVLSSLDSFLELMQEALNILSESYDPASLNQLIQPLSSHQAHLREQLALGEQGARLRKRLHALTKTALNLNKTVMRVRSRDELDAFANECNQFFDRCDKIADQLDSLQAEGHEITALEKTYERLVMIAGQLQHSLAARQR